MHCKNPNDIFSTIAFRGMKTSIIYTSKKRRCPMVEATEVTLNVKCPVCGVEKTINVPGYVFGNKQFGALKIQIPVGSVCAEHQFLIYVDKKGIIRSYETSDYQLPSVKREHKENLLTISDFVAMVGEYATLNVLHALLLNVPIIMVQSQVDEKMGMVINKTLHSLLPAFFPNSHEMCIIDRKDFRTLSESDEILAIDEEGYILACPWEINKFEIEEEILDKVLKLEDYKQQKIIFQQLLTSFFRKLNFVGEMLMKNDVIYENDLREKYKKHFMQKRVSNYELELIKGVLKNRFDKDISKIKLKSFDKLKESLW